MWRVIESDPYPGQEEDLAGHLACDAFLANTCNSVRSRFPNVCLPTHDKTSARGGGANFCRLAHVPQDGKSPLHVAVARGNASVVKVLLNNLADVHFFDPASYNFTRNSP